MLERNLITWMHLDRYFLWDAKIPEIQKKSVDFFLLDRGKVDLDRIRYDSMKKGA